MEIGTVAINCLPGIEKDPVFQGTPAQFFAHATHSQTVMKLPDDAVRLAWNAHEPNHAFRLGKSAWGVQFHPEYRAEIMRTYIVEQSERIHASGQNVAQLVNAVSETPVATEILRSFVAYALRR